MPSFQLEAGITVGGEPLVVQGQGNNLESAVQTYTVSTNNYPPNEASGSYSLDFNGAITSPIPFNATAAQVQASLQTLLNTTPADVGGQVIVSQTNSSAGANDIQTFTFPYQFDSADYAWTYTLSFDGYTTAAIAYTGDPVTDQTNVVNALNTLGSISGLSLNGLVVAGAFGFEPTPTGTAVSSWIPVETVSVQFNDGLANQTLPLVTVGNYVGAHVGSIGVTGSQDGSPASQTFTVVFGGKYTGEAVPTLSVLAPVQNVPVLATGGTIASGVTYYYEVTAVTSTGETIPSNVQSITTSAANQEVNLSWTPVAGATSYNIYRTAIAGDFVDSLLATTFAGTTNYTDLGNLASGTLLPTANLTAGGSLAANTTYYYVVTAVTATGQNIASGVQTVTTTAADQAVNLTWNSISGAIAYDVYRTTTAGNYSNSLLTTTYAPVTSYTDEGSIGTLFLSAPSLAVGGNLPSNTYYYLVSAVMASGQTLASNVQTVVSAATRSSFRGRRSSVPCPTTSIAAPRRATSPTPSWPRLLPHRRPSPTTAASPPFCKARRPWSWAAPCQAAPITTSSPRRRRPGRPSAATWRPSRPQARRSLCPGRQLQALRATPCTAHPWPATLRTRC